MNWGTRIVISFIIFVGVILTMVIISFRQDVNLVADDYYKQEMNYQTIIDSRSNDLKTDQLSVTHDNVAQRLIIESKLPVNGQVQLYRPSDKSQDKVIKFSADENKGSIIPLDQLKKGYWKIKLSWNMDGKSFYRETNLML